MTFLAKINAFFSSKKEDVDPPSYEVAMSVMDDSEWDIIKRDDAEEKVVKSAQPAIRIVEVPLPRSNTVFQSAKLTSSICGKIPCKNGDSCLLLVKGHCIFSHRNPTTLRYRTAVKKVEILEKKQIRIHEICGFVYLDDLPSDSWTESPDMKSAFLVLK